MVARAMPGRFEANGEKRILWRFLNILVAVCATGALLLGTLNAWAIRDYLEFKTRYEQNEGNRLALEAATRERMKWQEATLSAIAEKLEIPIPPPPQR